MGAEMMGGMARQFEVMREQRDKLAAEVQQLKLDLKNQCLVSLAEMEKSDALQSDLDDWEAHRQCCSCAGG